MVCTKDRRLVDVTITEKGQNLLKKLDAAINRIDDIVSGINDKEAETLSKLLDKLREGTETK